MGLINITPLEDGTDATANLFNTPLGKIVGEINGNLDSANLKNNAVTTAKIADGAVTSSKINTSVYIDDNGWTVHDMGSSKTYSRNVSVINTTITNGLRAVITQFEPPVGRTRDNINLVASWYGINSGHAIPGIEPVSTTSINVLVANQYIAPLTFNGNITVTAVETI